MARVVVDIPVATAGSGRSDGHNDGHVGVVAVIPGVVAAVVMLSLLIIVVIAIITVVSAVVIVDHYRCCRSCCCCCCCLPIKPIHFWQLDEAKMQGLAGRYLGFSTASAVRQACES